MNITLPQPVIAKALGRLSGIVERKHSIPILSNVMLTMADGRVTAVATDMNLELSETLDCPLGQDGALTVPVAMLHDIVRNASADAEVTLALIDKDPQLKVASGRSRFSVPVMPAAEFPTMSGAGFEPAFTMDAKALAAILDAVAFAVGTDELKTFISGVYMHPVKVGDVTAVRCIATDTHRLAWADEAVPDDAGGFTGRMLPRKAVAALERVLTETMGEVAVSFSPSLARFESPTWTLTTRLVDATFPDYPRFIPTGDAIDKLTRVEADDLIRAVRRALIVADDKSRSVRLDFSAGMIAVSARGGLLSGSAADEIECDYDGPDTSRGFNGGYLTDVLGKVAGKTITLGLGGDQAPMLITDDNDASFLLLLTPQRI